MSRVKLTHVIRDSAPCKDCSEKFTACHDHCPKDKRGEYGYKAFQERIKQVNDARKDYSRKYNKYHHDYGEDAKDGKG
jgi:hypothetical protein